MEPVKCFFVIPSGNEYRYLRRYSNVRDCPGSGIGCHNAKVLLSIEEINKKEPNGDILPHEGLNWPTNCICGYEFTEKDNWQLFKQKQYKGDGEIKGVWPYDELPVGAMWFNPLYDQLYKPQLEHCLCVKCPDGYIWVIDSQASNCRNPFPTRSDGSFINPLPMQQDHHCWIIHGTPPNITVDVNGNVCGAGGGSIQTPNWHGFLTNGVLFESR